MTTLDYFAIREELCVFLRNSDIFTTTVRGVTTDTDTGTFASDTSHLINVSNIKNIRSVVVGGVTLVDYVDYTVDYDYDDSGTIKCQISFTSAQTGAYTITYDYGSDRIFPDFPKATLTISNFPRISVDVQNVITNPAGFGNVHSNRITVTIVVYSVSSKAISDYMTAIRSAMMAAYNSFKNLGLYVRPVNTGPILNWPPELGKNKVFSQATDYEGNFKYEK